VRGVLTYLGHFFAAIIGTAFVEAGFRAALPHLNAVNEIVRRELIISVVIAFGLGALASYVKPTCTAYWIWLPMSLAVALRIVFWMVEPASVLGGGHTQTLLAYLGLDLEQGHLRMGFVAFFDFLLPAVRTIAYSLGAFVLVKVRPVLDSSGMSVDTSAETHDSQSQ
jgi:hypothetical protein